MSASPGTPSLYKRKDFLGVDEDANSHPNRTYYFRKNVDVDEVIATCSKRLLTHPQDTKALFLRGSSLFKRQKYELALHDLNAVAELNPGHIEGYYYSGMALSKMNQQEEAIVFLSKVLEMNPNHVNAAFARAACYNTIGQFSRAIEDYNFALLKDESSKNDAMNAHMTSASKHGASENNFQHSPSLVRSRNMSFSSEQYAEAQQPWGAGSLSALPSPAAHAGPGFESSPRGSPGASLNTKDLHSLLSEAQLLYDRTHGPSSGSRPSSPKSYDRETPTLQLPEPSYRRNGKMALPPPVAAKMISTNSTKPTRRQPPPTPVAVAAAAALSNPEPHTAQEPHITPLLPMASHDAQDRTMHTTYANQNSSTSDVENNVNRTAGANGYGSASTDEGSLAEHYHTSGYQLRRTGDFEGAVAFYTKALSIEPTHFKALFNRGFAKDKLGLYDQAVDDYTEALHLEPNNAFAYYNRGISNDRRGSYENAYNDFTAAIHIVPDNADFFHNRAFCLRKLNRLRDAVSDYGQSLALQPGHFKALHNRAYCLERLHDLEGAATDYSSALEMEPRHVASLSARAVVYERLEVYDLALLDYELALECVSESSLDDMRSNPLELIKRLRSELHLHVSIARLLSKVGRMDDSNLRYGECLVLSKSIEEKEKLSGIHHTPDHDSNSSDNVSDPMLSTSAILCARGINYKASAQYKRAIEDFTTALHMGKSNKEESVFADKNASNRAFPYPLATVYNHRGFCYRKLDKYEESIADYTNAIKYSTPQDSIRAYNNRAYCLARIEKFQQAVNDYTVVVHLDPLNSHAYHNRGISLDKLGQFDKAIADFTRVLSIDSQANEGDGAQQLDNQDRDELEHLKQMQEQQERDAEEELKRNEFTNARTADELDENVENPFNVKIVDAAPPLSPHGNPRIINASAFLASLPAATSTATIRKKEKKPAASAGEGWI